MTTNTLKRRTLKVFGMVCILGMMIPKAEAGICDRLFRKAEVQRGNPQPDRLTDWRADITNPTPSAREPLTNLMREKMMRQYLDMLYKAVVDDRATPAMALIPANGSNLQVITPIGAYGSGQVGRFEVQNIGSDRVFKATLLLPVSGHNGVEKARAWAKTDTYSVYLEKSRSLRQTLIKDAKSRDIITIQEVDIPMTKGEVVRVLYDRSGSAGPYGYVEGRIFEFIWNGN